MSSGAHTSHRPRRPPTRRNTLEMVKPFLGRLSEGTVHRKLNTQLSAPAQGHTGTATAVNSRAGGALGRLEAALTTSVTDAVARGTWAAQYTDAETLRAHTTTHEDEYTEVEARLMREINTLRRDPKAYADVVKSEATIGYPFVLAEDLWFESDADAVHLAEKVEVPDTVQAALTAEAMLARGGVGSGSGSGGRGNAAGGAGHTSNGPRRPQSSGVATVIALTGQFGTLATSAACPTATTTTVPSIASGGTKSKRAAAADASAHTAASGVTAAIEAAIGPATPSRVLQQRLAASGMFALDYAAVLGTCGRGVPLAELSPSPLSAATANHEDPFMASADRTGDAENVAHQGQDRYTVSGGLAELNLEHLRTQFARYQHRRQALFSAAAEVRQQRDAVLRGLQDAWSTEDEKSGKRGGAASGASGSNRRSMAVSRRSDANTPHTTGGNSGGGTVMSAHNPEAVQTQRATTLAEFDAYFAHQLRAIEDALLITQDVARRYMDGANVVLDVMRALKDASPAPPLSTCRGLCLAARETAAAVLQYPEECAVLTALSRPTTLATETLMSGMAAAAERAQKRATATPTSAVTDKQNHHTLAPTTEIVNTEASHADNSEADEADTTELLTACAAVTGVLRRELLNLAEASHEACSLMGYFSGEVRGLQAYGGGAPRTVVLRLLLGISVPHFTFRDGPMGCARDMLRAGVPEWRQAKQLYEGSLFHRLGQNGAQEDVEAGSVAEPSVSSLFFGGVCHPISLAAAAHVFREASTATTSAERQQSTAAQRLAPLMWADGSVIGCSWQRVYTRLPPPVYDDPSLLQPIPAGVGSPTVAGLRYHDQRPHADQSPDSMEPYTVAATILVARSFEELDLIRQSTHLPLEEVRRLVIQNVVQNATRANRSDVLVRSNGELQQVPSPAHLGLNDRAAVAHGADGGMRATTSDTYHQDTMATGTSLAALTVDAPRQAVIELRSPSQATLVYPASHPLLVPRWASSSAATPQGRSVPTTACIAVRAGPPSRVRLMASLTGARQAHLREPVVDPRLVLVQRSEADPWIVLVLVDLSKAEQIIGGHVFLVHLFESSPSPTLSSEVDEIDVHGGPVAAPVCTRPCPFVLIGVVRLVLAPPDASTAVTVVGNAVRTVSTLRAQTHLWPAAPSSTLKETSHAARQTVREMEGNSVVAMVPERGLPPGAVNTPWPVSLMRHLPASIRLRTHTSQIQMSSSSSTYPRASPAWDSAADMDGWPATSLDFQQRCGAVRGPLSATLRASRRQPVHFSIFLPTGIEYGLPQMDALRSVLALIDREESREAALEAADTAAAAATSEQNSHSMNASASSKSIAHKRGSAVGAVSGSSTGSRISFASASASAISGKNQEESGARRRTSKSPSSSPLLPTTEHPRRRSSVSPLVQMREEREEAVTALRTHSVTALGLYGLEESASPLVDPTTALVSRTTTVEPNSARASRCGTAATLPATTTDVSGVSAETLRLPVWQQVVARDAQAYANMGLTKLRRVAGEVGEEEGAARVRYTTAKDLLSRELKHLEENEIPKRKGKDQLRAQSDAEGIRQQLADLTTLMQCLSMAAQGARAAVVLRERDQLLRRDRRAHAEEELRALEALSHAPPTSQHRTAAAPPLPPPASSRDTRLSSLEAPENKSSADRGRPPLVAPRRASTSHVLHGTDVRLWLMPNTHAAPSRVSDDALVNVIPLQPSVVVERASAPHQPLVCLEQEEAPLAEDRVLGVRYDVVTQVPAMFSGAAVLLVDGQEAVRWSVSPQ